MNPQAQPRTLSHPSQNARRTVAERSQKPPTCEALKPSHKPLDINDGSQVRLAGATPTYGRTYGLTKKWETWVKILALRNAHEKSKFQFTAADDTGDWR